MFMYSFLEYYHNIFIFIIIMFFYRGGSVSQVELINPEVKKKKSKYSNSGVVHFGSVR